MERSLDEMQRRMEALEKDLTAARFRLQGYELRLEQLERTQDQKNSSAGSESPSVQDFDLFTTRVGREPSPVTPGGNTQAETRKPTVWADAESPSPSRGKPEFDLPPTPDAAWRPPAADSGSTVTSTRTLLSGSSVESDGDLESLVGGRLLNRVAAVALVLGLGFFTRIASEHSWVTPWMRILMGVLLGCGLLACGALFHRRGLIGYSYGLTGAGFASLYVSIFASYSFYRMIGFLPAYVLLSLVTAATVVRAVGLNAQVVAGLGLLSGFLTPMVLHGNVSATGPSTLVPLFTYLWALDAGVLGAAWVRDWKTLRVLSLVFTVFFIAGWIEINGNQPDTLSLLMGATAFFALFIAIGVEPALIGIRALTGSDMFVLLGNPIAYVALVLGYAHERWPAWTGWFILLLSVLYGVLTVAAVRRVQWDNTLPTSLLAIATGLAATAIGLLCTGSVRLFGWDAAAVVLLWGGCQANARPIRQAAYWLYGLVFGALVWSVVDYITRLLNSGFRPNLPGSIELPFLLAIGALVGATLTVRRWSDQLGDEALTAEGIFTVCAAVAGAVGLTIGIGVRTYGDVLRVSTWLTAGWLLYALILLGIGVSPRERLSRELGFWMASLVLAKLATFDLLLLASTFMDSQPLSRTAAGWLMGVELPFLIAVTGALAADRLYRRGANDIRLYSGDGLTVALTCTTGLEWLTLEVILRSSHAGGPGASAWLSAAWSAYAAVLLAWGVIARRRAPRLWGLAILCAAISKVFLLDIWSLENIYRVISLLTLAAALWVVSYIYARFKDRIRQLVFESE